MTITRTRRALPVSLPIIALATLLLAVLAMLLIACQSNPNEFVQSNEYFRPSPAQQAQVAAADQPSQQQTQQPVQQQSDQAQTNDQSQQTGATAQQEQQQQSADDDPQAQSESATQPSQSQDEDETGAPLQTSDDIIRRYSNPSYGYSFELICSPFCSPTSNGIDAVSFLSDTGRALVGVNVVLTESTEPDAAVIAALMLDEGTEFTAREETTIVTGEPAVRYTWEEDRRATGGFQVRWNALWVAVDDLAFILRAGAVLEDYEAVEPALERVITSFILPIEVQTRPGEYERFGFHISYNPDDTAQEFGQPTSNPPSEEAGIFVLQSSTSLKAVLTWQVLGEAFYDGDTAIEQSLSESLGIESATSFRDWGEIDGLPARTGESETQFAEGTLQIQSFAWYCPDLGREFALHVLDADDPETVALPLIESFLCNASADEAVDQ